MAFFTYPLLTFGLVLTWLLLAGFTPGQFVLSIVIAILATEGLKALGETSPKIRRTLAVPRLLGLVLYDVFVSNIAVARIVPSRGKSERHSGFITVPIRLKSPSALAILALILTSTPGTAWLDYSSASNAVTIHVLDLTDEEYWIDLIASRYEQLLMEIFE